MHDSSSKEAGQHGRVPPATLLHPPLTQIALCPPPAPNCPAVTYKWDFDFHSYGHQKYILYKKFYEKDEEEEECHDCDEEDNDKCYKKVYYRICYLKHNHKRVSGAHQPCRASKT